MPAPDPLRLALIADIHYGPVSEGKDGASALQLLDGVLREIAAARPALVVDLGDRITETTRGADAARFQEVASRFRRLDVPWVYLPGNHDLVNLSLADCEALLGVPIRPHSLDLSGWHLVFWQVDCRQRPGGRAASRPDIDWLEADLESTDRPSIVFTHVPFDSASMVSNFYFERSVPGGPDYTNSADIRAVVERTDRAVLVVAAHVHWNSLTTINGIRYVTIQGLTETFTTHPHPAGGWAMLDLHAGGMRLEVRGGDPVTFALPFKPRGHHWLRRVPPEPSHTARALGTPNGPGPLSEVRGVILDLDGVVYSGSDVLPGVREFLAFLRDTGRRIIAVTNHSGLPIEGYAEKLARLGVPLAAEHVLTSSWATGQYLRRLGRRRVFIVGSEGLRQELAAAGCVETDTPEVVVVGYTPLLDGARLIDATRHLLAGASFVGTNADALLPTPDGPVPECGPMLAYLEAATGQRATVVGKPNVLIVEQALSRLGVAREHVLIVGDTVDTDIAAGLAAGIRTALVLTGNARQAPDGDRQPTVTVPDLIALRQMLAQTS